MTIEDVRKSDLLAELTDVMSDGVSQDLWLLSVGIDNNPWGPVPAFDVNTEVWISKYMDVSTGDSELGRVSSGWVTNPSLSKFGGS